MATSEELTLKATGKIALVVGLVFLARLPYKLADRLVSFPIPPKPMAVVITGTSSGIGKHAALHLDEMGVTVYSCVRKQADADALLTERPSLRPVVMDIGEPESVKAAVDHIVRNASGDSLDICGLVNNAGMLAALPLELESEVTALRVLNVNVLGAFRTTNALLPALRKCNSAGGGGARIVNIGSLAGKVAAQFRGLYSSSKHALEGLSDSYRYELETQNISVSIVEPGYVQSGIADKNTGSNAPWLNVAAEQAPILDEIYGGVQHFERLQADFMKTKWARASPPSTTTEAITDAIFSPNPKCRYPVASAGDFPSWLVINWIRWILPDRFMDAMIRASYNPDRISLQELFFSAQPGKKPKDSPAAPPEASPADNAEL